jgi:hypothetical protein
MIPPIVVFAVTDAILAGVIIWRVVVYLRHRRADRKDQDV